MISIENIVESSELGKVTLRLPNLASWCSSPQEVSALEVTREVTCVRSWRDIAVVFVCSSLLSISDIA